MTNNLAPGAVVEEVEEGGSLPALAAGGGAHNHYHIGTDGRDSSRRRGKDDRNVLGLVDRERDRELERQILDRNLTGARDWADHRDWNSREWAEREAAWKRDQQILKLLDKDRERDQRSANRITGVLDEELSRSRLVNPEVYKTEKAPRKYVKKLKAGKEPNDSQNAGLMSEMEALREDFQKLLRSSSNTSSAAGGSKVKRGDFAVSGTTARRGRQESSPVPEIQFDGERTIDAEAENSEVGDEEDEEEEEEEDGTAS